MRQVRIFISSPGDVVEERERAREVVESLRRRYAGRLWLKPVLWEDLPLQADASFQEGIDVVLDLEGGVDVGVFILWSRMGELQGGGKHRSGTEREFELLREARERSGGQRPALLVYARADDAGFAERLRGRSTAEQRDLLEQKAMVERFIEETFQDAETGRNLRAFHRFDRPQTFSQRLRAHLSELLDELAGDPLGTGVVWDVESQGPPFMGLEAFGAEQAEVFFGREHEVLEGRRMLKQHACDGCAFLLITGASGSGKSSLARAGLLPEVEAHEVDETVVQWRTLVVMPGELGEDAVAGLVARMGSADVLPELCAEGVDVGEVVAGLKRDAVTTVNLTVKRAAMEAGRTANGGVRVLLLVDQLEEAFSWGREARETFFVVLEALARSGVVWVLATVRGDFLGEVHESEAMGRLLAGQSVLTVLSPGPDALRRMIEEPARLAGLRFEERDGRSLGDRILADAARHADLLPLVEFVLLRLYEQRDEERNLLTFAAYEAMGGVEGALSRHAEQVFSGMGDEERDALATVLKRLVTLGEARGGSSDGAERVLRQRVALGQFGSKETAARRLVDALVETRLLTAGGDVGTGEGTDICGGTVTVAHEALLRVWPRAAAWVEGNRELLRVRARVAGRMEEQRTGVIAEGDPLLEAAKIHLAADPEAFSREQRKFIERSMAVARERRRQRERTRRSVMASMAALTLTALAGGGFAWTKQREAEEQRVMAEEQRAAAEGQRAAAEGQRAMAEEQRAMAEEQREMAEKQRERATIAERNLEKQLAETRHQFERWQLEEGRAWLLRARVAKGEGNQLSALLYAGRAVGFHEYGRLDHNDNGPDGGPYPSLLGAPLTVPAVEEDRIREESEARDFVRDLRPTCLPIWSSPLQEQPADKAQHADAVNCLAYSPDGTRVASGMKDGTVQIWCVVSGRPIANLSGLSQQIWGLAFSRDGTRLAAGSMDRHLKLWDAISGREIASLDTGEPRNQSYIERPSAPTGLRIIGVEPVNEPENEPETAFVGIPFTVFFSNIVFSPDGKHLASGAENGILTIWNAANGTMVASIDAHKWPIRSIAFDKSGSRIATGSADATVKIWDVESGRKIFELEKTVGPITRVAFSPGGTRIACGFSNGNIGLWNAENGKNLHMVTVGPIPITTLLFSPDGKRLAASSTGAAFKLFDVEKLTEIGNLGTDFGWVGSAAFSPDGKLLACASPDGTVKLWNGANGKSIATIREHAARVMSVAFSPDGTRLLSGAEDGNLKLWDVATEDSPDSHRSLNLLALEREGYLRLVDREVVWEKDPPFFGGRRAFAPIHWRNDLVAQLAGAANESERMVPEGIVSDDDEAGPNKNPNADTIPVGYVSKLDSGQPTLDSILLKGIHGRFSACGALAVMAGNNVEWGGSDAERKPLSGGMQARCINIALSKCGGLVAGIGVVGGIGPDGSAVLWQRDTDLRLEIEADEKISPYGIILASGGQRWASVDRSGRALLREFPSGKTVAELYAAAPREVLLAFSPDGGWLVGTNRSQEGIVQIFDAETGDLLRRLEGHKGMVGHVSVSPDGRHVATSSIDGTVRIWEAGNGGSRAVLGGHRGVVYKAGFDRAGERVATASRDGRARVWTLDGKPLREVRMPGDHPVGHAGFSPDGRLLATVSKDGRLRLWHAERGDLLFDTEVWAVSLDDDMFSPDGNKMVLPTKGGVSVYDGIAGLGAEKSTEDQEGKEDAGVEGKDHE